VNEGAAQAAPLLRASFAVMIDTRRCEILRGSTSRGGLSTRGTCTGKVCAMSGTAGDMRDKLDEAKDTAEEGAKKHEGFLDKMKDHVEDAVDKVKDVFDGDDDKVKPA
jgi:hypothetical protein